MRRATWLLTAWLAVGGVAGHPSSAFAQQTGPTLVSRDAADGKAKLSYVVVTTPRRLGLVAAADVAPDQNDGLFLSEYLETKQQPAPSLAMSGGLLRSFAPATPLGFLKANGKILSQPSRIATRERSILDGVACFAREGKVAILDIVGMTAEQIKQAASAYRDCVQAGPLMIVDGRRIGFDGLGQVSKDRDFLQRNASDSPFVCTGMDGATDVVGIASGTSAQVAAALLEPAREGWPGCKAAIRMTGGATAALRGSGSNQAIGADSYRLPDAVVIY